MTDKIIIYTQYRENYGAHNWDGEGECPQYWKSKWGYNYVVLLQNPVDKISDTLVIEMAGRLGVLQKSDYSEEYMIGWEMVQDSQISRLVTEEWDNRTYVLFQASGA